MPEALLHLGDCLDKLRKAPPPRPVDLVLTDPPAGIGMNGAGWDGDRGGRLRWVAWLTERLGEARKRCRPGARLVCWSLPRQSHWTGWAIAEAGWVVEDLAAHLNAQAKRASASKLSPGWESWWVAYDPRAEPRPLRLDLPRAAGTKQRHPRNVLVSEGSELAAEIDAAAGERRSGDYSGIRNADKHRRTYAAHRGTAVERPVSGDSGGVTRYFSHVPADLAFYAPRARFAERQIAGGETEHPTAKALSLMLYLANLADVRAGDLVLDPFMGSGTSGEAALICGADFWGCEQDPRWFEEAWRRRLAGWVPNYDPV